MNITLHKKVHVISIGSTTLCGLNLDKRRKLTHLLATCPDCLAKEKVRVDGIKDYIQKLLANEGLTVEDKLWRLVGYVEGGLRQS